MRLDSVEGRWEREEGRFAPPMPPEACLRDTAGCVPGHPSKARIAVKPVVIFFNV